MVIGCEAELYLHKLQAETKRVSELTRSISERCQSRLTCVGRPGAWWACRAAGVVWRWAGVMWAVGPSSKPASHLFGGMETACVCYFIFCPIITVSFFLFFSGTLAGTKFRQEDTIQGTKFRQEDTVQGTKSRTRADQGHTQGVAPSSIPLGKRSGSGSDQPTPGANEFKATGCAALTLITGYARLSEDRPAAEGCRPSIRGRSGCLGQFINHLARPAPNPARRKRPS